MISAIIVLSFLIFFHELGHFLMAKLVGVKVEVFSIGFGKKLFCKKIGNTNWCISVIPLGGYVQMKGQDDTNPALKNYDADSYNSKTPWQRILILLGGPGFNFLLAFLIYFFVAITGWPKLAPVIGGTIKNMPAYNKLHKGDVILEVNGIKVKTWDEISSIIQNSKEEKVLLKINHNGKIIMLSLEPKIKKTKNIFNEPQKIKIIGIYPSQKVIKIKYPLYQAIIVAWNKLINDTTLIFKGIEKLITGSIGLNTLSGPIGIVDVTSKVADMGIIPLLFLSALLSVNLGVLNLLPIPALDGGHIVFNLYEGISKKEISEEIMVKLTIIGWIILGSLMLIGIYNDIMRIIP